MCIFLDRWESRYHLCMPPRRVAVWVLGCAAMAMSCEFLAVSTLEFWSIMVLCLDLLLLEDGIA